MILDQSSIDVQQINIRKSRSKVSAYQEFQYPQVRQLESAQTIHQIRRLLHDVNMFKSYTRGKYTYYRCRFCNAKINIKFQEQKLSLLKYSLRHKHSLKKDKFIQQQLIKTEYEENCDQLRPQDLKRLIISKFSISFNRYTHLIRKFRTATNFNQIIKKLESQQFESRIFYGNQQQVPQLFLTTSPIMRKQFEAYGDVIYFDITYNLLKIRSKENKQWGVGFMSGFDNNLRIVLFAVVLICNENTQNFCKIFREFFSIMNKNKIVIISDEQKSVDSALKILRQEGSFTGLHLFDVFHLIKNLRKNIPQQQLQEYKKLLYTPNILVFQSIIQKLKSKGQYLNILNKFQEKSSRFCISRIPPIFIGLCCTNSISEKLNDLIKILTPRQTNLAQFFINLSRLQKRLCKNKKLQFQTRKYQILFKDPGILLVRQSLQIKLFNEFLGNYAKAMRSNIQKLNENLFLINNYKVSQTSCQCLIIQKKGIICSHMIRFLWERRQFNYIRYFNDRWFPRINEGNGLKKGRPKNSRKNLLR